MNRDGSVADGGRTVCPRSARQHARFSILLGKLAEPQVETIYPGCCRFRLDGVEGTVDWDVTFGIFWISYGEHAFEMVNLRPFQENETRTEAGFSVKCAGAEDAFSFRLSRGDDTWLEITEWTVRSSEHFTLLPSV
jgi:hypothetical protein